MGRWTQYDEDEYRLPEGMKRVGYDADSGRYYFKDRAGKVYEGAEGAEFSEMVPVSSAPAAIAEESSDDDLEAAPRRADGYQSLAPQSRGSSSAYRTLFPFFLMIVVVLLLIWRLVLHPSLAPPPPACAEGTTAYRVKAGDTCWDISQRYGVALGKLKEANTELDCDRLAVGKRVCVPPSVKRRSY
ncbi:carbohydrate-binding module family 50 protein [Athelia psychrophila]|uniref:Carbohydrate-binding module family 50 protein n=1 Tax=Athelia psychrophila TaxID=1759441 RepID=A0A166SDU8_9AGAM|nr:carbohydrate-binding module family 50 protein [Fibularhizoctonia sp. CBS 109695]